MSEEAVIELAKTIGALDQRLKTVESLLYNETIAPDSQERTNHVVYPVIGTILSENPLSNEQFRYIKNSMCKVQIAGDFNNQGRSVVVEIEMTRDEFDDYLAKNPSSYGEYILKVTPSYEEYL